MAWWIDNDLQKQIFCEQKLLHRGIHGIQDSGQQLHVTRVLEKKNTLPYWFVAVCPLLIEIH